MRLEMLIIDKNSVYEIDEECLKRRKVQSECGTAELAEQMRQKEKQGKQRKHKKER